MKIIFAALAFGPGISFADSYRLAPDPNVPAITFHLGYSLGTHDGSAANLTGALEVVTSPSGDSPRVSGELRVPIRSLKTGNPERDCHLLESLGLDYTKSLYPKEHVCSDKHELPTSGKDAIAFPEIVFKVDSVSRTDRESRILVRGEWTIHGVTRHDEFPLTMTSVDGGELLKGSYAIRLADFGIEVKSAHVLFATISVADSAHVDFNIMLRRPAQPEPAYVQRGHQTEKKQKDYHEHLERFYSALSKAIKESAPDLLPKLNPPGQDNHGYQILPKIVADSPPRAPGEKLDVSAYTWPHTDSLFDRETKVLDGLDAELGKIPHSPAGHPAFEKLIADYRKAADKRDNVDSHVQYNWHWQAQIQADRPLFDRLEKSLDLCLERDAIAKRDPHSARVQEIDRELAEGRDRVSPPSFVRPEHPSAGRTVLSVPLMTDITDPTFVRAFQKAVEDTWHIHSGSREFSLRLNVETITPEKLYCDGRANCVPPAKGTKIDLDAHLSHFPKDRAVLTTGATTLKIVGLAIVVSPYDVQPRVLAHEFGHILGFPDLYLRGYQDLGADGFMVKELVDPTDIMGDPVAGPVLPGHFERIVAGKEVEEFMGAGLTALYQRHDPLEAAKDFREVLARNANHYGATLQLAKALDQAGKKDEALPYWKKMLGMAEAANDAESLKTVKARLGSNR
jgi:polyisoprenoid-binding protein YceI